VPVDPWLPLAAIRMRVPIADDDLVPPPSLFRHESGLHGQAHVARVLVLGFGLMWLTGHVDEAARLWAAVYLHDIARTHDGRCPHHGAEAWARFQREPDLQTTLARGGVGEADHEAIAYAVAMHSRGEPASDHPHYRLAALLKDADALDRVRLNDLKIRMLRHAAARGLVPFAQRLYDASHGLAPGPDLFSRVWTLALREVGSAVAPEHEAQA